MVADTKLSTEAGNGMHTISVGTIIQVVLSLLELTHETEPV